MELFKRRPLCFFCFLFAIISAFIFDIGYNAKWILLTVVSSALFLLVLFYKIFKSSGVKLLTVILCVIAVLLAIINSFCRIDLPQKSARRYIGEAEARMDVLSIERVSESTSAFAVELTEINGDKTSLKSLLVCGFEADLRVGDLLIAPVEIVEARSEEGEIASYLSSDVDNIALVVRMDETEGAKVERFDHSAPFMKRLFSENGGSVVLNDIKTSVKSRITELFGEGTGALAKGFLLGDRSDISTNVIRDFRRSGVSHLFAVSGLHVSILLGAVELLMRKLCVPKRARCIVIILLSFVLLFLTGFSTSALRSVFMLWIVYLVFFFSEEADPPTTLFLAISMIIAVFPYSVNELGMWMSFFATLGLVTVYPIFEAKIREIPKGRGWSAGFIRVGKKTLMVIALTIVSNMFLLPVQWKVFGEMSIMSIPANVVMSPLSAVFLVSAAVALLIGDIPLIGRAASGIVVLVGNIITDILEIFSLADVATVSLKYYFADALVITFTVAMVVLLVIKIKRKWLVSVPFLCFALVFTFTATAYEINKADKITYYGQEQDELFAVTSCDLFGIIDASDGAYYGFYELLAEAKTQGATTVDFILFTKISETHISTMEYLFRSSIVEKIYLPKPQNEEERELALKMASLASESKVRSELYENRETIPMKELAIKIYYTQNAKWEKTSIAFFVSAGEEIFGYTDAYISASEYYPEVNGWISESKWLLIGNNGIPKEGYSFTVKEECTLVYSSAELMRKSGIHTEYGEKYCNDQKKIKIAFELK